MYQNFPKFLLSVGNILSLSNSPLLECHNVSLLFHQLLLIGYKINVKWRSSRQHPVFLAVYCRIPGELGPTVRMLNPPQTYAQAERQMNLVVPKFKNAAITPTMRPVHWTPPHKDIDDVQVYKRLDMFPIFYKNIWLNVYFYNICMWDMLIQVRLFYF